VLQSAALVGGGSRSAFWGALCATALGLPLRRHVGAEVGAALGAARLGRLAQTGEDVAKVCVAPEILETYRPDSERQEQLMRRLAQYRRLYVSLAEQFGRFSQT
jgi:xylulokinase